MKTVHSFAYDTGAYIGPVELNDSDLSPLEEGVYLIPGNCVEVAPPAVGDRQFARWAGHAWEVLDVPAIPAPAAPAESPTPEPVLDPVEKLRGFLAANPDVKALLGA